MNKKFLKTIQRENKYPLLRALKLFFTGYIAPPYQMAWVEIRIKGGTKRTPVKWEDN